MDIYVKTTRISIKLEHEFPLIIHEFIQELFPRRCRKSLIPN